MIGRKMTSLIVLSILVIVVKVTESEFSDSRDDEVNRLLKKLNKPALESIKSPDGDIIDCVHMRNHPIYDNPLFKNHTIQMRPSSYPDGWKNSKTKKQNIVFQQWTINGKCPKNSIPIIRTKREDILRAKSIERYVKKDPNSISRHKPTNSTNRNTHEYAILRLEVNSTRAKFHGTKAALNVWKPYVQNPREFSLAQIWLTAGLLRELNSIEVGWQVYEFSYGDDNPRLFIYWTSDGYRTTGCYNLRCGGFVPINQEIAIGGVIPHVSTLNGTQETLPITIWKDPRTGNWWLKLFTHLIVGYWPSSLFDHMQNGATEINWGGEIINMQEGGQHTLTHMGSGRFAEQGWAKASYFSNIEILDESETVKQPLRYGASVTDANCYNLRSGVDETVGTFFYYGGPGRNPNCH